MHIKKKIAIISHSLGRGGAERFAALLSFILSDLGYEIHNIVINENVDYEYSGTMYNLGEICKTDNRILRPLRKGLLLKKYLAKHNIGTVIDNRSRNIFLREWFAKKTFGNAKRIYVVHNYNIKDYLPESVFLARLLYADAEKLVCVSKAIESLIKQKYGLQNTITIYNPAEFPQISPVITTGLPEKYLLFFGRLEEKSKNFSLMLEAFALSKVFEKDYKLVIMGDGPDKESIEDKIKELQLEAYTQLIPYQKNPFAYVSKARFTVLTSRYEGFPMSIIESLALQTPVIAVDCTSGPSEIIQNEKNGLLVPNYNPTALANAISLLAEDEILYDICKNNAVKSIGHLSVQNISAQWKQILQ